MSWDKLSMAEKAEVMKLAVQGGIYDLDAIRGGYNEYAKGGKIHIKPENRGKFTALKKRTGHSATWFKQHGTPAQKKMATFALNARKWKHEDGGELNTYDEPQTFAGRVAQVAGASPEVVRGADVVSSVAQMTPYGHFIGAMDLGRDLNRVYHGEEGAWWDSMIDAASMLPFLRQSGLKAEKTLYNTVRNNKTARKAINGAIGAGKAGDFISDTWGANKSSKAYGGELGNYYDGLGDFVNSIKSGVKKAKQKVKDLGFDKSPGQYILSAIGINDSNIVNTNQNKNSNIGFIEEGALDLARSFGLNNYVKGKSNDTHYRQNLYNIVDPTDAIPDAPKLLDYARAVKAAKSDRDYSYQRFVQDPAADAAWAKRLGLPYDTTILVDNGDGSVRLSNALESQIPVDTLFLKQRIADNEDRLTKVKGKKHQITGAALDYDRAALDSLRETYRTGKPVQLDENSAVGRNWRDNKGKITSPLNLLHRYTVQYDKKNNRMNYWDLYDFNEFEDFVPGEPFKIKGSIDLNKKDKR